MSQSQRYKIPVIKGTYKIANTLIVPTWTILSDTGK